MQTLFELKTRPPFDADTLERIKQTASELLRDAEQAQYTQAIVLFSKKGNEYGTVLPNALSKEAPEESALLERLVAADDTAVGYILCMWADANIDIPSRAFRTKLLDVNPENADANVFVMTQNGVSVMKLGNTMR